MDGSTTWELRWALILVAVLFIAGVGLWEWRRGRRRPPPAAPLATIPAGMSATGGEDWQRRIEPHMDSLLTSHAAGLLEEPADLGEVPVIHPVEPISVPVAREAAVDVPAAAGAQRAAASLSSSAPRLKPPEIRWPPERADRVLSLRIANAQGAPLQGREVRLALEQGGLVPGPQTIYHRTDSHGAVLVSAANMVRPGDLDPQRIDELQLRGLSLFSVLPGPLPPVRMLEELVAAARALAWRLGASVQDEHGSELDGERLVKLRQSLPDVTADGAA